MWILALMKASAYIGYLTTKVLFFFPLSLSFFVHAQKRRTKEAQEKGAHKKDAQKKPVLKITPRYGQS